MSWDVNRAGNKTLNGGLSPIISAGPNTARINSKYLSFSSDKEHIFKFDLISSDDTDAHSFTIQGQDATGDNSAGGDVVIIPGQGTSRDGYFLVSFYDEILGTEYLKNVLKITKDEINPKVDIVFPENITTPAIYQEDTPDAIGREFLVSAQDSASIGGQMSLTGGDASTAGGTALLSGGVGSLGGPAKVISGLSTVGNQGFAYIAGHNALTGKYAGEIDIFAGNGDESFTYGGDINIISGSANYGGDVYIAAGNGKDDGGDIYITGGKNVESGLGGDVYIYGGDSNILGVGGNILISAGEGTSSQGTLTLSGTTTEIKKSDTQRAIFNDSGLFLANSTYSTISATTGGNIAFPSWEDLRGDISQGTANAALTYETYRDTSWKCYHWRHDQDDELHFAYQMPHSWNKGDVIPHLHIVPLANGSGNFVLDGKYTWVPIGQAAGADSAWTTISDVTTALVAGDQYYHKLVSLGTFSPPSGIGPSTMLLIYIRRDSATDTYSTNKTGGTGAANIALLSADLHFQINKLGTATSTG